MSKLRSWRVVLLSAAVLLLTACGGGAALNGKNTGTGKRATVPAVQGGGYYLDDGPGDEIPANLDDIPDAVPRWEPLHKPALKPYNVLGKNYVPFTSLRAYKARGKASWYGKKFHGQKTSIGEPYDMFAMTAAHTTLALPSYVRVTSVRSGKSVVVRVIDRGPFHAGRIIDLSYTAAHKLGLIADGSGDVVVESILPGESVAQTVAQAKAQPKISLRVLSSSQGEAAMLEPMLIERDQAAADALFSAAAEENVGEESSPTAAEVNPTTLRPLPAAPAPTVAEASPSSAAPTTVFYLQLGAFANADNADNMRTHLTRELAWLNDEPRIYRSGKLHRLQLGPYPDRTSALNDAARIKAEMGFQPALVSRRP